jgi:DNA (cytosine-5)-methyltransferase 1
MVWENVPGAFSSNGGKDFQAVLTEIVRIVEPDAPDVPMPDRGGWSKAGCLYDELGRWSIAWRVHDAQFWGVPQRRKRIALVADFGGLTAPEIPFERKGLSRHSEPRGKEGQGTARSSETSLGDAVTLRIRGGCEGGGKGALVQNERSGTLGCNQDQTVFCLQGNGIDRADNAGCNGKGVTEDVSYTLNTIDGHAVAFNIGSYHSNAWKSPNPNSGVYETNVSKTLDALNCGAPTCNQGGTCVVESLCIEMTSTKNTIVEDGISPTLTARMGTGGDQVNAVCMGNGQADLATHITVEISQTLNCMHDPMAVMITEPKLASGKNTTGTLMANAGTKMWLGNQEAFSGDYFPIQNSAVRRLTPLECERLQGFPSGWTDIGEWVDSKGKKHKEADSPRYKALGNSIALPFWQWMARRICAQYERAITMASLFDGIGGFPLVFERCGAKAVWASEIEEFPIAVTKLRFPEE